MALIQLQIPPGVYRNGTDLESANRWRDASLVGGDVTVTMTGDADQKRRDVNISSMGGDIELTLPKGLSADFDIRLTYTRRSSQDFEIRSDFPIKITKDEEWRYRDGDPRKTINGSGEVNGGKHTIKVSTINGNITIRKR